MKAKKRAVIGDRSSQVNNLLAPLHRKAGNTTEDVDDLNGFQVIHSKKDLSKQKNPKTLHLCQSVRVIFFWASENRKRHAKMAMVAEEFIKFSKAESLHFNHIPIALFQIHCGCVQWPTYKYCITVQVLTIDQSVH